jgi:hypothetical protein
VKGQETTVRGACPTPEHQYVQWSVRSCYIEHLMAKVLHEVLRRAETWPQEDQEALAEYARELGARRTGVYRLPPDERDAIDRARQGDYVPDDEMEAYWKRHGIA